MKDPKDHGFCNRSPVELFQKKRWIFLFFLNFWDTQVCFGQESQASQAPIPFFFDADSTGINRDLNRQTFDGHVVAIGAGTIIAGDHISFDRAKNSLIVSGHIFVVHLNNEPLSPQKLSGLNGAVFTGDRLFYRLGTGDFVMKNAVMVAQDPRRLEEIVKKVFGFSQREINFELEREKRLSENAKKREVVRQEAVDLYKKDGKILNDSLIDRYAVLMEQEELIKTQDNPSLGQLDPERRERLKARRENWELTRQAPLKQPRFSAMHFRLEGGELVRTDSADYVAYDALITPCRCEEDEAPAWAFRAQRIDAQMGGYADLLHPVLEIKGIPILYLPMLSLPIKDERQSGFLPPSVGFEARSGNIYSQPVYFAIDQSSDGTLMTDLFEKRGTRLGFEYRIQQREDAGWNLRLEGIRDQLWLKDRALRQEMAAIYRDGLEYALKNEAPPGDIDEASLSPKDRTRLKLLSRDYWEKNILKGPLNEQSAAEFRKEIDRYLVVPDNAWRGSIGWGGVSFFSPRLSLVSSGQINSDHRYIEDLYVPANYQEAFFGGRDSRAITPARVHLHADGKDFYAGLGAALGDNHLLEHRFEGQQLPQKFKLQSRAFSLLPPKSLLPAYGQLGFETYGIRDYRPARLPSDATQDPPAGGEKPLLTLGDGQWQRIKLDQVTPVYPDGRIQINQFADVEHRKISHNRLVEKDSSINSYRFGVEFRLPIDGKGRLPDTFQDHIPATEENSLRKEAGKGESPSGGTLPPENFVHHLMDWRLRFSSRPVVVKNGLYTDGGRSAEGGDLAYFAGDRVVNPNSPIDNDVPEEDRMKIHRRVSLSTEHLVRLFKRSWTPLRGTGQGASIYPDSRGGLTKSQMRAREELLQSLGLPVTDPGALIDRQTGQWSIDRYQLSDTIYASPFILRAQVAYDFLDAEKRQRQRQTLRELDQEIADLEALAGANQQEIDQLKAQKKAFVLAEPWKNPNVFLQLNHAGYSLSANADYSIYLRTTTAFTSALGLPPVWGHNLGFGYSIGKEYLQAEEDFRVTTQRSISLASSLTSSLGTNFTWARKTVDGQEENHTNTIRTAAGFNYSSPSQCWGIQGLRVKEFGVEDRDASYTLQFSMVFMGQQRSLPNMSSGIMREFREDTTTPQS